MNAPIDTVRSIVDRGRASLEDDLRDHIALGAGTNSTITRNRTAWDDLTLHPRVLSGTGRSDPRTSLLGVDLSMPVLLAPVGPLELIHPDGAVASATAAKRAEIIPIIATSSSPAFAEVAAASGGPAFAQLYWWGDRSWVENSLDTLADCGYRAVVFTVDAPSFSVREHDKLRGYSHHAQMHMPNLIGAGATESERLAHQSGVGWDDVAWLIGRSRLPVVIKGVTSAQDASRASEIGASAIYVSNHGGRVLDHMVPTAVALESVADAADVPIVVDGCIESAADVVKAVAIGADAVAIGRLQCWALADTEAGLPGLLETLEREIVDAMTVLGSPTVASLGRWALGEP